MIKTCRRRTPWATSPGITLNAEVETTPLRSAAQSSELLIQFFGRDASGIQILLRKRGPPVLGRNQTTVLQNGHPNARHWSGTFPLQSKPQRDSGLTHSNAMTEISGMYTLSLSSNIEVEAIHLLDPPVVDVVEQ